MRMSLWLCKLCLPCLLNLLISLALSLAFTHAHIRKQGQAVTHSIEEWLDFREYHANSFDNASGHDESNDHVL